MTDQELLALLAYDQDTGHLTWRKTFGRAIAGTRAGWLENGYVCIMLRGRKYRAHRLAWLIMTGEFPPPGMEIDHRDGNRANNAWNNLRLATHMQACTNRKKHRNNTSGTPGVYWQQNRSKWTAQIGVDWCLRTLGYFDTKAEAIARRLEAERRFFGEFSPNHDQHKDAAE